MLSCLPDSCSWPQPSFSRVWLGLGAQMHTSKIHEVSLDGIASVVFVAGDEVAALLCEVI